MSTSTFLGQGTYGCVYKQKLKCIKNTDRDDKKNNKKHNKRQIKGDTMTKVHRDSETALNEIEISKEILKIPNYSRHFSPILESCNASLAQISKSDVDKCDFINTNRDESINTTNRDGSINTNRDGSINTTNRKPTQDEPFDETPELIYFTTKSKYIVGEAFDDYYKNYTSKHKSQQRLYDKIMYMYAYLLAGAKILNEKNIVHCDIKASNIIVDQTDRPIYIDFGLSVNIKQMLKRKSYRDIYFFHPLPLDKKEPIDSYEPWCVEIALMSYIEDLKDHNQEQTITHSDVKNLQSISDRYIDDLKIDGILFTQTDVEKYKEKKRSNIANFVGQTYDAILKEVTEITYSNWDTYAISIMILKYLEHYIPDIKKLIRNEHLKLIESYLFR